MMKISAETDLEDDCAGGLLNPLKEQMDLLSIINQLINDKRITTIDESIKFIESYIDQLKGIIIITKKKENNQEKLNDLVCNHCRQQIVGIYYCCSHCQNVILCEKCENLSEDIHDFNFIKVKKPLIYQSQPLEIINKFLNDLCHLLENFKHELFGFSKNSHCIKNFHKENLSKIKGGSKITKIWNVTNNGTVDWDEDTVLKCISANIMPQGDIPISLKAGQSAKVCVPYLLPSVSHKTLFYSIRSFFKQGKFFGDCLIFKVLAMPNRHESESVISSTYIEYPPCFNFDIPFLKKIEGPEETVIPNEKSIPTTSPNVEIYGQSLICESEQKKKKEPACLKTSNVTPKRLVRKLIKDSEQKRKVELKKPQPSNHTNLDMRENLNEFIIPSNPIYSASLKERIAKHNRLLS